MLNSLHQIIVSRGLPEKLFPVDIGRNFRLSPPGSHSFGIMQSVRRCESVKHDSCKGWHSAEEVHSQSTKGGDR